MAEQRKLRIFVASPSDVEEERALVSNIVQQLREPGGIASSLGFSPEVFDWRSVSPMAGDPQETITEDFSPESSDIFVGIFWHRFGTPSGHVDDKGKHDLSGTEQELKQAIESWRGNNRPKILLYRNMAPVQLKDIDARQISSLNKFFSNLSPDLEQYGLSKTYSNKDEFAQRIKEDLTKVLLEYGFDENAITNQSENVSRKRKDYCVFISHSSKDLFIARQVGKEIRAVGAQTWLDESNLEAGGILVHDIFDGIKESNEAIVLLSADSIQSQWVNAEIGAVLALDKRLTPLLINVDHTASQIIKDRLAIHVNDLDRYLDDLRMRF